MLIQDSSQRSERAIQVEGLSKRFKVYRHPFGRFADLIREKKGRYEEVWALRDISFSVGRGECFGIVGINGSGKSTLLKLISGTLRPTCGSIDVRGRALALLELGGGINPELSGRQNVIVSADLLGFPRDYAASKLKEIEAFADIGEFFDRPMRIYSSGMYVRLAFSIYLFMEPDVLIVDEALSVGDIFFQQKCFDALRAIMQRGSTILFVSHDTGAVQKLCQRSMLLDHGRVDFIGLPDEVINRYYTKIGHQEAVSRTLPEAGTAEASAAPRVEAILAASVIGKRTVDSARGKATIAGVRATDEAGKPATSLKIGAKLLVDAVIEAKHACRPDVAICLYDRFGDIVFATTAGRIGSPVAALAAGQRAVVRFALDCSVAAGTYTYRLGVLDGGENEPPLGALTDMLGPLIVTWDQSTSPFYGQLGLPGRLAAVSPVAGPC